MRMSILYISEASISAYSYQCISLYCQRLSEHNLLSNIQGGGGEEGNSSGCHLPEERLWLG